VVVRKPSRDDSPSRRAAPSGKVANATLSELRPNGSWRQTATNLRAGGCATCRQWPTSVGTSGYTNTLLIRFAWPKRPCGYVPNPTVIDTAMKVYGPEFSLFLHGRRPALPNVVSSISTMRVQLSGTRPQRCRSSGRWATSCVLIVLLVATSCTSGNAGGSSPRRSGQSEPASSTPGEPPPLNPVELKVRTALDPMGLRAERAENSPPDRAAMSAVVVGGERLYVNVLRDDLGSFSIVGERNVDGVTVREVEFNTGDIRDQFLCSSLIYEVYGAIPSAFESRDKFLSAFIRALRC